MFLSACADLSCNLHLPHAGLIVTVVIVVVYSRTVDVTQEWVGCKGSKPERRGYTCGLWLLLHSLAAESQPEQTGGSFWMTAVRCCALRLMNCCRVPDVMYDASRVSKSKQKLHMVL